MHNKYYINLCLGKHILICLSYLEFIFYPLFYLKKKTLFYSFFIFF